MTNVLQESLTQAERAELMKQLSAVFAGTTQAQAQTLFCELLTSAEQVLLIKRLAVILMIHQDYSLYRVSVELSVSPTTVKSHKYKYSIGTYKKIIHKTNSKKFDSVKFWNVVDTILRAGMPPMAGPGRWGNVSAVKGSRSRRLK